MRAMAGAQIREARVAPKSDERGKIEGREQCQARCCIEFYAMGERAETWQVLQES